MKQVLSWFALGAVLAVAAAPFLLFLACQQPPSAVSDVAPRIELNPAGSIDVVGLPVDDLAQLNDRTLSGEEWTALLRVAVAGQTSGTDRPAVLGAYEISDARLRFIPQFPFDPGQRYDVVLDPLRRRQRPRRGVHTGSSVRSKSLSPANRGPRTSSACFQVRRRCRKTCCGFTSPLAPMSLAGGSQHVRLLEDHGRVVEDPFLPLEVDLWNEDRTRYTLLFDPRRVKRGIPPNEQMGRSLVAGRRYTLIVDDSWRDANGQPLSAPFRLEVQVGPPIERAIDPAAWRLEAPIENTRQPLTVSFPAPLDYALLRRTLTVLTAGGARVPGDIEIATGETAWIFTPQAPWVPGEYRLLASSILEDSAGNRIGRPFEAELLASGKVESGATSAVLPFRVLSNANGRRR